MIRPSDGLKEVRAEVDTLIDAGRHGEALNVVRRHWAQGTSTASSARYVTSLLPRLWPQDRIITHRVAFLRSMTIEPLLPLLQATAALDGCQLDTWVGEFNAYPQEILDPESVLYAFEPDSIVLAVQSADIAPRLWFDFADLSPEEVSREIEDAAGTLIGLLKALRGRCAANLIVHGLETPLFPAAGLYDLQRQGGQIDAFDQINRRLREYVISAGAAFWFDYERLQSLHGRRAWHDEKKRATVRMPFSIDALGPMSVAWWRILAPLTTKQAKVLVVDLDNTLWGGVLGEDGFHGIQIGNDFPGVFYRSLQRTILDVAQRGIVLAISSKNNESEALEALASHPGMLLRPQHFSSIRINWRPKAESIAEIAAELNVGVDAIAFLDDNPAEREAVRSMLPQVQVIELPADPARYSEALREFNGFERLTLSSEDSRRARYYLEEHQRRAEQAAAGTLEDFLHSLEIVVKLSPVNASSLGRAAQLTQKTNQFNLTTKRYTEADLSALLRTAEWAVYTLSAQDRFGDSGIVGVAIMKCAVNGPAEIDSFLLSCRVIGRGIEKAFLALLAEAALAAGSRTMEGWFLPTAKNAPAANLYSDGGFECVEEGGNGSLRWKADLRSAQFAIPAWILTE